MCCGEFVARRLESHHSAHKRLSPMVRGGRSSGGACTEADKAQDNCYGGIARLATKVSEIRRREPNVILLDAGDQFSGTSWFYVFKGGASAHFMNYLHYDCMVLGNHEFDIGISGLVSFLDNVTFPVISANINATLEPTIEGLFTASAVMEVDGREIGIVGYTLEDSPKTTLTGDLIFYDEISSVQAEVNRLRNNGIDIIIALGHSGYALDLEIAKEVDGVDVVVGGHSHSLLYTGVPPDPEDEMKVEGPYPTVVKSSHDPSVDIPVVTAYQFGKYLGHLKVTFDDGGNLISWADNSNPIILDAGVDEDEDALAEVEKFKVVLDARTSEVIGYSQVLLDGSAGTCRLGECNLGNMITDAAVHHYKRLGHTGANIAIWNSDGYGDSIYEGNITFGDLLNTLPYDDTIDILDIQGKYLLEALEYSVSTYDGVTPIGRFLQLAGIRAVYDTSRPAYQRVLKAEVVCTDCSVPDFVPLDKDAIYKVITNTYVALGGAGYDMLADNKLKHVTGDHELDIMSEYISTMTPIYTGIERRTTFSEESPCDAVIGAAASMKAVSWMKMLIYSVFVVCSILK
ncbi:5'-nucleotidase-like [Ptychodera flava]|uniref:5'-nucleotidase-like n=1 Tax=Ptychodera flava TaxID=63121 RepID=UPI003969EBE9